MTNHLQPIQPMTNSTRATVRQLAQASWAQGDPTGWFEVLYAGAQGEPGAVPWADLAPNPNLLDWLHAYPLTGSGKRALVVGCGLGDDAEELARLGFAVTAFDIAPTAIAWCQQRFPDSAVSYEVADLLDASRNWAGRFDFVLEAYTLQALPEAVRGQAIAAIARCVAPAGQLLVICRGRDPHDAKGDLPFPLTRVELMDFERHELQILSAEDYVDESVAFPVRRFRILYGHTQSAIAG